MNWLEWLIRRRDRRPCRAGVHDIIGPEVTLGGWHVYLCTRCPHRYRADGVIGPNTHTEPDMGLHMRER